MGRLRLTLGIAGALCVGALSPGWAETNPTSVPSGEIIWDKYGIPHIYGKTTEDVLYGYGYAQKVDCEDWAAVHAVLDKWHSQVHSSGRYIMISAFEKRFTPRTKTPGETDQAHA